MTPSRPPLTDAQLHDALARRVGGSRGAPELLEDVLDMVESSRQQRAWPWLVAPLPTLAPGVLLLALAMAAAVGFALVVGAIPVPDPEATSGDIAFVHIDYPTGAGRALPANPEIRIMSSQGGAPSVRVAVPGTVRLPRVGPGPSNGGLKLLGPAVRWSPDGSTLAFRLLNDSSGIYLMSADGSDVRLLVDLPDDELTGMTVGHTLDWSPDGRHIAYAYPIASRASDLSVVDVDDGHVVTLTDEDSLTEGATRTVDWSPDGSRIAYAWSGSIYRSGLWVSRADGTAKRELLDLDMGGHVQAIAWSPDGTRIAFLHNTNPVGEVTTLQVINRDGTGRHVIAELGPGGCCILSSVGDVLGWSPDGDQVAFIDPLRNEGDVVVLAGADGSGARDLIDGSFFDWSPDGSQLVVSDAGSPRWSRGQVEAYSIYVINADGSGRRWLAFGEYPAWSPVDSEPE